MEGHDDLRLVEASPHEVVLELDGLQRRFEVAAYGSLVHVDSPFGSVALEREPRFTDAAEQVAPGPLLAPMPGAVVRDAVQQGDEVADGQVLLWLEAMKMQHEIAPQAGVVTELAVVEVSRWSWVRSRSSSPPGRSVMPRRCTPDLASQNEVNLTNAAVARCTGVKRRDCAPEPGSRALRGRHRATADVLRLCRALLGRRGRRLVETFLSALRVLPAPAPGQRRARGC